MGQLMSMVSRRANRFNAENRAHRVIAKEKPTPAPKYPSNLKEIQKALELNPDLMKQLGTKDSVLDERLKQVYVTSQTTIVENDPEKINIDKPLPIDTKRVPAFEFGYKDPEHVPPGKVTMQQVAQFLGDFQRNSTEWNKEKIAEHYRLPVDTVDDILRHFRPFQVYLPDPKRAHTVLEGVERKAIPESSSKDKDKEKKP
ncbi:Protein NDUFAF4 homolog [Sergentomyia squamirostris]